MTTGDPKAADSGAAGRVPLWVLRLLVVVGVCIFVGGFIIGVPLVALAGFCFAAAGALCLVFMYAKSLSSPWGV